MRDRLAQGNVHVIDFFTVWRKGTGRGTVRSLTVSSRHTTFLLHKHPAIQAQSDHKVPLWTSVLTA